MRHLLAVFLLLFGTSAAQADIKWEVVKTLPHDTRAFTQGLFIADGQIYESTGLVGRSELRVAGTVDVSARGYVGPDPAPTHASLRASDGVLYVAEQNRVLQFPAAEFFYEGPDVAAFVVTKQGDLIPPTEESFNHTARVCRIGSDNKLYISLGQPFNVPAKEKLEGFAKYGIGGIIRMDQDGKNREVYASGVRNSVGMDFNPKNQQLWFTDNQVDGMGDGIPPGELNRVTQMGQNFGFPYYGGGKVRTNEYKADTPPAA